VRFAAGGIAVIPEVVREELKRRRRPSPRADRPIRAGDLRRCDSAGESRLVLVLKVIPERETVQVTLIHSLPEYATANDVVLDPSLTGLTYATIAQGDLRGVVWLRDLGRLVAQVPQSVVTTCLTGRRPSGSGSLPAGLRLAGPLDARWDFKVAERESLARLCADCTSSTIDTETLGLALDEIFTALLTPAPDAVRMLESLHDLWKSKGDRLHFTLDHVEFLFEQGLLDTDKWEAIPGGPEFRTGPMEMMIERARSQYPVNANEPDAIISIPELIAG
jgi:hypothetical protein